MSKDTLSSDGKAFQVVSPEAETSAVFNLAAPKARFVYQSQLRVAEPPKLVWGLRQGLFLPAKEES